MKGDSLEHVAIVAERPFSGRREREPAHDRRDVACGLHDRVDDLA
jgi:hypothetical protein